MSGLDTELKQDEMHKLEIVPNCVGVDAVVENICNYSCKLFYNIVGTMVSLQFSVQLSVKDKMSYIYSM